MEEPVLSLVDLEYFFVPLDNGIESKLYFFLPSHMVEQTLLTCSVSWTLKFCCAVELPDTTAFRLSSSWIFSFIHSAKFQGEIEY